jgi:PUA domain protein
MKPLSNKDKKKLSEQLLNLYKIDIKPLIKKQQVFFHDELNIFTVNKKPIAFINENTIYPTLLLLLDTEFEIPYVVVDLGAVKHILNGADIFRPGITEIDRGVKKDKAVIIVSEDEKLLAIGKALYDYEEMLSMEKGKVIKNLHYFGDKIFDFWKSMQER